MAEAVCPACFAENPEGTLVCEKCGSLIPKSEIVLEEGDVTFVAESSNGFLEHQSGFFRRVGDNWIVAELTLLRGVEYIKKKDTLKTRDAVKPILFYNLNGRRGYKSLKERSIEVDGKTIILEGTVITKPMETLMSFDTATSFLKGRNEELKPVFVDLKERIAKFVNFEWDPRLYDLAACATIATYFFDVFRAFPIIFPYGPQETGKSRLVKCIVYAGRKGLLWVSPTPASIYRGIDAIRPTLGVDEFTKLYEELMQVARAIYKRGLMVPRMEKGRRGERFFLTFFETYTPLIVGSTRELDPVTMSRTIVVYMRKAKDPSKRDPEPWDFEDIRDRLYICRLTHAHEIDEIKQGLDAADLQLIGREYEIWRPILTIARAIDGNVYTSLLGLAQDLTAQKYEGLYEEEKDVLYAIYRFFFRQTKLDMKAEQTFLFYPKQISDELFLMKEEEFGYTPTGVDKIDASLMTEARRKFDKVYGSRKIGWILKRMGMKYTHTRRGNQYSLSLADFRDLAKRFGVKFEANEEEST
ncbi:MAG: hypothetical protein ACE5OW_06365 [Candidatus Bathyarchaeia archaeon]